jgi:hypothetical protein
MIRLARLLPALAAVLVLALGGALATPYIPKPKRDFTGNLVVNGSFHEPKTPKGGGHADGFPAGTTALTGWTVSGGSISVMDIGDMPEGRVVVLGSNAAISQPLDLPPGRMYEVSFLVTCAPAGPKMRTGRVTIAGKSVPFEREAIYGDQLNDQNYWTLVQFQVAGTGKTVLEIRSTTNDPAQHGPNIADVIVSAQGFVGQSTPTTPPAEAIGDIVKVEGDVLTLDQKVVVGGRAMTVRTHFYLQDSTERAKGWTPTAASRVRLVFRVAADGRRLVVKIEPSGP